MPAKIELLKTRDFGEVITDTFVFIRENFKPLIKCFVIFCGFFVVASAVFSAIQQAKAIGVVNEAAYLQPQSRYFGSSNPFTRFF